MNATTWRIPALYKLPLLLLLCRASLGTSNKYDVPYTPSKGKANSIVSANVGTLGVLDRDQGTCDVTTRFRSKIR